MRSRPRRAAERIAADAERAGLVTHRGRKVLELRPPVAIDKGSAVEALLARRRRDAPRSTPATTGPTSTPSARSSGCATSGALEHVVADRRRARAEGPAEIVERGRPDRRRARRPGPDLLEALAG